MRQFRIGTAALLVWLPVERQLSAADLDELDGGRQLSRELHQSHLLLDPEQSPDAPSKAF
jgi:hypothetical protein